MIPTSFLLRLALLALAAPAALAQTPATLDKIKQSGSMTLAYRESSIPFSFLDDKAQPTGFAYEICEKIAENVKRATGRADLKKQYQSVTSANRIPLLQNGKKNPASAALTDLVRRFDPSASLKRGRLHRRVVVA